MSECRISLGSNINDRLQNIRTALDAMTSFLRIKNLSSIYETEPLEYTHQGWFLNMVVQAEFNGDPHELLMLLNEIQEKYQKKRAKNAPRIIDLDILTFENYVVNTDVLTLPHPKMCQRLFVLLPLKEIIPDFICPQSKKHIDTLLETCEDRSRVNRVGNLMNKDDWRIYP